MRLTLRTDYAIRVMIFLARNLETGSTVKELAALHSISHNHLVKIANDLCNSGLLIGKRGRGGGLWLAIAPEKITVGQIVGLMEADKELIAGCNPEYGKPCILSEVCRLRHLNKRAVDAFMKVLHGTTLRDLAATNS